MDDADRADDLIERERAAALARCLCPSAEPPRLALDGTRLCLDCGERIPTARLRVLPRALRCVHCAADHEGRR
jgi:phage/conjugal plasmid C-4 type zinc finger TraR family protein